MTGSSRKALRPTIGSVAKTRGVRSEAGRTFNSGFGPTSRYPKTSSAPKKKTARYCLTAFPWALLQACLFAVFARLGFTASPPRPPLYHARFRPSSGPQGRCHCQASLPPPSQRQGDGWPKGWPALLMKRLLMAAIFCLPGIALAHEANMGWRYDAVCCNGNETSGDCQEIPRSSVKAIEGGYEITLNPGDHRLVSKPQVFFRSYDDVRQSMDGEFHACLWPSQSHLQCFYAPPMAF